MTGGNDAPSRLALKWIAIANALGLRITAPVSILLPSGSRIDADALLLDFGGPKGTLLVTDEELVWNHRTALAEAGYGFSTLSDPGPSGDSMPSLDEAIHVLRDWGWEGDPENMPAWMRNVGEPVRG
jgi:hypothetical protein